MARISELHYSNAYAASSGVSEFLEVALRPSEDPADFVVSFYQANGTVGLEVSLSDPNVVLTVDPDNGEFVYVISADAFSATLTDPNSTKQNVFEAFSLTNTTTGTVIDFYDIGRGTQNIVALDGAAADAALPGTAVSANIPTPTRADSTTTSIQFNQPNPDTAVYTSNSPGDTGPPCFVAGTEIMTPDGPIRVDDLAAGDLVLTRDNGPQPLRWCGRRTVAGTGKFAPVRFAAGRYGATRNVSVSPQHRILLTGWQAELLFGAAEVFVPAKALIDDRDVRQIPQPHVTYHHLLFDAHQVIESHGFWSESYFPIAYDTAGWRDPTQQELLALFPQLAQKAFSPLARPAIPVQTGKLLRQSQ